MLDLLASSIRPGPPLSWQPPGGGRLAWLVAETATFLGEAERTAPDPLPAPSPEVAALPHGAEAGATSTGTAFYLGVRTLVTAQHVVADCSAVTLADGTALSLLASDADLDVAALMAPDPAPRWLSLADGKRVRLGERVHAAGLPLLQHRRHLDAPDQRKRQRPGRDRR